MRVIVESKCMTSCGICDATKKEWIQSITIGHNTGIYCSKCDTLTVAKPIGTRAEYQMWQQEVKNIRQMAINS